MSDRRDLAAATGCALALALSLIVWTIVLVTFYALTR